MSQSHPDDPSAPLDPPGDDAPALPTPLPHQLRLTDPPNLTSATLLVALSGWMDGGLVSTGTVRHLMEKRSLVDVGEIAPGGFYIDNFPGNMEIAAVFRPELKYEGGLISRFEQTTNRFSADVANQMLFFVGKEPNLDWPGFAACILHVASLCRVRRIMFIGSFGGTVPHTREPRLFGAVSSRHLLPLLQQYGIRPSDYEGPASFASFLVYLAPRFHMEMLSISAEIPGYLQGLNPLSIEAVARRLAPILGIEVDLAALRSASTEWELRVSEAVEKDKELARRVRKLEEQYDNELIGNEG